MDKFEREEKFRQLLKEFEQTDAFYAEFKTTFTIEMFLLIREYYPAIKTEPVIDRIIDMYANELISSTEAVLDKDINSPEYRKIEEIDRLTVLIKRESPSKEDPDFIEKSHLKAKEVMVQFYPDIQELSSEGFKMLELNSKLHHLIFLANLRNRELLTFRFNEEDIK